MDTGAQYTQPGNLELAPGQLVGIVDKQHGIGIAAVVGQRFAAFPLAQF